LEKWAQTAAGYGDDSCGSLAEETIENRVQKEELHLLLLAGHAQVLVFTLVAI
jgi:hypothetical protein